MGFYVTNISLKFMKTLSNEEVVTIWHKVWSQGGLNFSDMNRKVIERVSIPGRNQVWYQIRFPVIANIYEKINQ
jgi:hypothetical protein